MLKRFSGTLQRNATGGCDGLHSLFHTDAFASTPKWVVVLSVCQLRMAEGENQWQHDW